MNSESNKTYVIKNVREIIDVEMMLMQLEILEEIAGLRDENLTENDILGAVSYFYADNILKIPQKGLIS